MTTHSLEIPQELYDRLRIEATRRGQPVEALAEELLETQLPPPSERARLRELLRVRGMLAELSPELKARAAQATMTLEEVQAAFARAGGKPLSEIVIEQRGPKL